MVIATATAAMTAWKREMIGIEVSSCLLDANDERSNQSFVVVDIYM